MAKRVILLFTTLILFFVNFNTYAQDNTIINNCYQNLKTDIDNTASGWILEISETGICEINESIVIDKPITIKVNSWFNFTIKLTEKVDSFLQLNSSNITIDWLIIDVNNNAYNWVKLMFSDIIITHNKIKNIYYDNSINEKLLSLISIVPDSLLISTWSEIEISHNEFSNIESKIYTWINTTANSIYSNFEKSWIHKINIKWNIFNTIMASIKNDIKLTTNWVDFISDNQTIIENNSFVSNEEISILSDLESVNLLIRDNTYNIEDTTVTLIEEDKNIWIWTKDKAEFLAKKVLYWVTEEKVQELFDAWSREAAVDLLFPSIEWPDRAAYNSKMSELLDEELLINTSNQYMREYYTFKKLEDPYEAKSKLFWLFEDTFSVDTIWNRINYWDIESTHDMLYSHTLWNYKEMVKRNLYNNWNWWDYSLWEYLDLFNQTRPAYPNENYAREIIQLFLMLEYKPTESEDLWSNRNYTEDDVNAMAKIIFWFEANDITHKVTYNNDANTNDEVEFLDWDLKKWDSFNFYNSWSWTIDIQALKTPIAWNNWLPDNIIDYIFSKRDDEIGIFLADKFYRFYIWENPTRSDLDIITDKILENDFDIYPTVKWLLSSDLMFKNKALNSVIYKNPLELIIWTAKILWLDSSSLDLRYSLQNLSWTPYAWWKIFWRDWYDDNSIFYTPYISNKWTSEASKFASKLIENNISFIDTSLSTPLELIVYLEKKLFLWKELDEATRNSLISYLTHDKDWNEIEMNLLDNSYIARNLHWLIYMMLSFPEYVLQSWSNIEDKSDNIEEWFYNNDNKIVFIKASGWLDWLHAIIPKNEYSEYLELRWNWAVTWTWLLSLNDEYYINSSMKWLKDLYDSWNARFFNRVWTPDHSRWHDSSSRKITSLNNFYWDDEWIFWHLIMNEDPSKTIVLDGSNDPYIFRNWKYMWIGWSAIFTLDHGQNYINTDEKNYKITTLKNILEQRDYIWTFWKIFSNWAVIDSVARESKANWWREWSWYNMNQRFTFLQSLYDAWLWNWSWLRADGWYDTHRNNKTTLDSNFAKISEEISSFFNDVKDKHNVTIVFYSEFWRTNKLNSSSWVDHWKGWWMFVISNNDNLLNNQLPNKVYWNNLVKDSRENYLWVWIDYRSVYSSIIKWVYSKDISKDLWAVYNINNYVDSNNPESELFRIEHKYRYNNNYSSHIIFDVDDVNFFSNQWSSIKIEYWTDTDDIKEISSYSLYRSKVWDKWYDVTINTGANKKYFYKITIFDNQYNKTYIDWSFTTPKMLKNNYELDKNSSILLDYYRNKSFSWELNIPNSSTWIILSNSGTIEYSLDTNLKMFAGSWTYVNKLTWSSWAVWNWDFIVPTFVDKNNFIWSSSNISWKKLSNYNIDKLLKIWANNLWIWMKLNKAVSVEVDSLDESKKYNVIYSEDWVNWNILENSNIIKSWSKLTFDTDHFTYFALVESDDSWNLIDNWSWDIWWDENEDEDNSTNIWYKTSSWWSAPRAIKDNCYYWDFSPSYYDNTCWIEPDEWMMDHTWLNNVDENILNSAISNLQNLDINKYNVYADIFDNFDSKKYSDSQKIILNILSEWLSDHNMWEYNLVHMKKSNYNTWFEKLADKLLWKRYNDVKAKQALIEQLNKMITIFSIYNDKSIDKTIRTYLKDKLISEVKIFIKLYKWYYLININKKIPVLRYTYEDKIEKVSKDNNIDDKDKELENITQEDIKNNESRYIYKVSPKSIFLKWDIYWKTNAWLLYNWDLVEQITNINSEWFFKVKVLKSRDWFEWVEWYIYAKYLEE